jgi:hypothetical protein
MYVYYSNVHCSTGSVHRQCSSTCDSKLIYIPMHSIYVLLTVQMCRQKHLVRTLMSGAASSLLSISSKDSMQSAIVAAADSTEHDINDISSQKKVYFALMRLHPIDLRLTYKALPTGDEMINSNNSNNSNDANTNSNNNSSAPAEVGALSTLAQVWHYTIVQHVSTLNVLYSTSAY